MNPPLPPNYKLFLLLFPTRAPFASQFMVAISVLSSTTDCFISWRRAYCRAGHLTLPKPRRHLSLSLFIYLLIVCLCLLGFRGPLKWRRRGRGVKGPGAVGKIGIDCSDCGRITADHWPGIALGSCSSQPRQRRRMGVGFGSEGRRWWWWWWELGGVQSFLNLITF